MKNMWIVRIEEHQDGQEYSHDFYVRSDDEASVRIYAMELLEEFYSTDGDENYHEFDGTWVFSPDGTRMAKIEGVFRIDPDNVVQIAHDLGTGKAIYLGFKEIKEEE